GKPIGVVAGKHQLELDIVGMADGLQRLLNAEAARIGLLAGSTGFVLRPVGELAGAETAHAADLVGANFQRLLRGDEDQRRIGGAQRLGIALRDPALGRGPVLRGQIDEPPARADAEADHVLADRLDRERHLALRAGAQLFEEPVAHRRGIEPGRAEPVEEDVALLEGQQLALPGVGDRAFLGQQRPGAELEGDRADLGVVQPILPFAQAPHSAGHEDRRRVELELAHQAAQLAHPRVGRFRLFRVLAVGQAVMAAGQPRILVDDAAEPLGEFVVGALPQRAEGARRRHDRVVVDAVAGANLGDAVRHAGAAGDAVDEAARAFEYAVQHPLGRRHLPQHVHVDAALAVGALMGDARLLDAAGNRVRDQLLMALAPGTALVDLRNALAGLAVAVGVDAGERADPARGGPRARALAVRNRDALAAFHQRQHLAPRNDQRFERLHPAPPCRTGATLPRIISGASEKTEVTPQPKRVAARAGSLTV